ncbi:MAG: alpha/beta fold hydrolase BchO [Pseudomonadota bacterium]
MDWARQRRHWPFSDQARQVRCRPHSWHVTQFGHGPQILFLHGAGSTFHSWRDWLAPLSQESEVIAIDLPGHGFSRPVGWGRRSLAAIAEDLQTLIDHEGWRPRAIVGHSAGVALALEVGPRMKDPPRAIVGVNAALQNFAGPAGFLFPFLAKSLAINPVAPYFLSVSATSQAGVRNMLSATGSSLDAAGVAYYHALFRDRDHIAGTIAMMAEWDLRALTKRLPGITIPVLLMTGASDLAVPASVTKRAVADLPLADTCTFPDLGHLAHEEAPELLLSRARDFLRQEGVLPAVTAPAA